MKKLYRSSHDRKLTGLCGGLAEAFNVDATLLRLVVAVSAFFSAGVVIPLYLIASWVIPKEEDVFQYAALHGHPGHWTGPKWGQPSEGWETAGHGPATGLWWTTAGRSSLDEMMPGLEKKAMENEIRSLREKLSKYEKENQQPKGDH